MNISQVLDPSLSTGGYAQSSAPPPVIAQRAPTSSDLGYALTQIWLDETTDTLYGNAGESGNTASWPALGGSSSAIGTINTNAPVGGNYTLAGTANQIDVVETAGTSTLSIPSTFTAPGSITATLGDITATNGNFVRGSAGNKDVYSSVASTTTAGANSAGTVTLVGGTATVNTTAVTANSQIRLYRQGIGATGAAALGYVTLGTKTAGVSFIINAVQPASATSLQTTDVSVIGWEIVN